MIEPQTPPTPRTDSWLASRLETLHKDYFPDVEIENRLVVRFGRSSRNRFGSIIGKKVPGEALMVSYITINGLFRSPEVPEYVIDATLVHEFVHYTHGFHSPRRQAYAHPHRGNIVGKEMASRGAQDLLTLQDAWIKEHYRDFLSRHYPQSLLPRKPKRRRRSLSSLFR